MGPWRTVVCWIVTLAIVCHNDVTSVTGSPPPPSSSQPPYAAVKEQNVSTLNGTTGPKSEICRHKPCIRKCCLCGNVAFMENENSSSGNCESRKKLNISKTTKFPCRPNSAVYTRDLELTNKTAKDFFQYIKGYQIIRLGYLHSDDFYVLEEGALLTETPNVYNRFKEYDNDNFCVDYVKLYSGHIELRVFALKKEDQINKRDSLAPAIGMVVSSVFLAMTLAVYSFLPSLRNLHGKVLMAYAACLLGGFLTQSILQLNIINKGRHEPLCNILGVPSYYALLAAFFWMNIMSFDIWYKFRSMVESLPLHRRGETHKFCVYCAYGFGCPLVMSVMFAMLNYLPHVDKAVVTPGIPGRGCFPGGTELLFYLYIPMALLLTANLGLFVATAYKIYRLEKNARDLYEGRNRTLKKSKREKKKFMVYMKICCLMGMSWILEILSSEICVTSALWNFTDIFNSLMGVFVFIIFVGKKRVMRLISKRYLERTSSGTQPTASGSNHTSNSDHSDGETCPNKHQICINPKGVD